MVFVVRLIAIAAASALQLLDDPVGALGAGVGDAQPEERLDRWPPRRNGLGEARGLWHVGGQRSVVEPEQPVPGVVRRGRREEQAKQLLDAPGGADLGGRVVGVEHLLQAGEPALAQPVAGGEQQPPVRPGRIGPPAAAAELLAGDPLAHLVTTWLASR